MSWLLLVHIRVGSRFYELGSVILLSSGVNLLTGALGTESAIPQLPLSGILLIAAAILLWWSAGLVSKYRENAVFHRQTLELRAMDDVDSGRAPGPLPSLAELTIAEGQSQPFWRVLAGAVSSSAATFLAVLAIAMLALAPYYQTSYKYEMSTPTDYNLDTIRDSDSETPGPNPLAAQTITTRSATFKDANDRGPLLQLDVHFARADADEAKPAILFLHGGGMMLGDKRLDLRSGTLANRLVLAGFTLVSANYRLAPKYKLDDAIADVQDACNWVVEHAGVDFPARRGNYVIMGESAGAYLSLVAGTSVIAKPACVISLWGYGDITGDWYTKPSEFFLSFPRLSEKEATSKGGVELYIFSRQTGTWPQIVTGKKGGLREFSPRYNVSEDFPPTLLLAGTKDMDVPYEQSTIMAEALADAGVSYELVTIPGGGHGWESTDPLLALEAQEKIVQFIERQD